MLPDGAVPLLAQEVCPKLAGGGSARVGPIVRTTVVIPHARVKLFRILPGTMILVYSILGSYSRRILVRTLNSTQLNSLVSLGGQEKLSG